MTITAWRVVKRKFAGAAFDGEGASLFGGRWNSPGRTVVYTSATTSLGLLETLVHTDAALLPFYITIPVTFEEKVVNRIGRSALPVNWRSYPAPYGLQLIGDEWFESQRSCVLEVPSVIVPHEVNFALNPKHPDFEFLKIGDPIGLEMDERLGNAEF